MGQFSWIAQDTQRSISSENPRPITMVDNKGNKWQENNYQGYGEFGGKDFYQLLAEINKPDQCSGNVDHDRNIGIDLYFGDEAFLSPNLYEDSTREWTNRVPADCPDQGWT
jgi:hypothetical protein